MKAAPCSEYTYFEVYMYVGLQCYGFILYPIVYTMV